MTTELDTWAALTQEAALEPDLPICDPHHHLWVRGDAPYFLPEFLRDIAGGHRVVRTVFVECAAMYRADGPEALRSLGETEFVQGQAACSASGIYGPTRVAEGIVGFADLMLGDSVKAALEAHLIAGHGRFRGIRNHTAHDPDPGVTKPRTKPPAGMMGDATFRQGFGTLHGLGLSFDAWLFFPQLPELADLAGAFPDTPIILNHAGTPLAIGSYAGQRDEVFARWRAGIDAVAACPNIVVKLGGLGMPMCGFGWETRPQPPSSEEMAAALSPWLDHCINRFGPDRCMFESNFPVDKRSGSFTVLFNAFKRATQDLTPPERAALFHDTAARVYRIGER